MYFFKIFIKLPCQLDVDLDIKFYVLLSNIIHVHLFPTFLSKKISFISTYVLKHNRNMVWYSIFQFAVVVGCFLIQIYVITVISYISVLRVNTLFQTDAAFFGFLVLFFHNVSKLLCHRLLWKCCVEQLQLITIVLRKLLYTAFTIFHLHWVKNIFISKRVVYT